MSNKKDNFYQIKSDLNLTVESQEMTILKTSSNNNDKIDYGYWNEHDNDHNASSRSEDIEAIIQDSLNVESEVCAEPFMDSQNNSRSIPYHDTSYGNNETNITSNNSINTPMCVETQPSEDCRLPEAIYKLFSGRDRKKVISDIIEAQNAEEKRWQKDESVQYKNRHKNKKIASPIKKDVGKKIDLSIPNTSASQTEIVAKALSIIQQQSFGGLILNSKNEILSVQNLRDRWSALKGKRKIKDNGELETPWETFLRELFEEISIKFIRKKIRKKLNVKNIGHFITSLDKNIYLECHVDLIPESNDQMRLIGLFIIRIDENKLQFNLPNKKENKNWGWLKIDVILNNQPEPGNDKYYTLRPFVKYLNDHPEIYKIIGVSK